MKAIAFTAVFCLIALLASSCLAQSPPIPDKSPTPLAAPAKSTPLASPQVQAQASPQTSFTPQYDQPAVVLRTVPQVYTIRRLVTVQAAPVNAYVQADVVDSCVQSTPVQALPVAYGGGCGVGVANNVVVQRTVIGHQAFVNHGLQSATVNHALVGAAVSGRQPKKIKTKQVTRVKRGLFGR